MRRAAVGCAVLLGSCAGSPWASPTGTQANPNAEEVERGKASYGIYCATCHGEQGHGDGPAGASLAVRPPDLTRLARAAGGSFPAEQVERTIDGRNPVPGHGGGDMPIWGLAFQEPGSDAPQEREVHAKIHALVEYLRSIQE